MDTDELFRRLYEEQFGAVFRAALALSHDRALAEDATQEAFARALERWDRLSSEERAAGWVTVTALNVVRRALRRRALLPWAKEEFEVDTDASVDLWRAVRELPRRQLEAIALHYIVDLPIDQVAHAMGCKIGTVKAHLHTARRALASRVENENHRLEGERDEE